MSKEESDKFFKEMHSRLDDIERRIAAVPKEQPSRTLRGGLINLIKNKG